MATDSFTNEDIYMLSLCQVLFNVSFYIDPFIMKVAYCRFQRSLSIVTVCHFPGIRVVNC